MRKNEFEYIWTDKKRTFLGLPLSFTRYFITKEKFVRRRGFLNIVEDEFELYKVADKKLVLPFGQRLFNCGTIVIHVKDVDTPVAEIHSVKNVRYVLKTLEDNVNIQRDKYNIRGRDMIGTSVNINDDDDN